MLNAGKPRQKKMTVRPRFSAPRPDRYRAHPISYKMGIWFFPGVKRSGRGVNHPPYLAQRLNSRAIPLLPIRVFMVCSRASFTFFYRTVGIHSDYYRNQVLIV